MLAYITECEVGCSGWVITEAEPRNVDDSDKIPFVSGRGGSTLGTFGASICCGGGDRGSAGTLGDNGKLAGGRRWDILCSRGGGGGALAYFGTSACGDGGGTLGTFEAGTLADESGGGSGTL